MILPATKRLARALSPSEMVMQTSGEENKAHSIVGRGVVFILNFFRVRIRAHLPRITHQNGGEQRLTSSSGAAGAPLPRKGGRSFGPAENEVVERENRNVRGGTLPHTPPHRVLLKTHGG